MALYIKDAVCAVRGVTHDTLGAVMIGSADMMGWFSFIELSHLSVTAPSMKKHDKKGPLRDMGRLESNTSDWSLGWHKSQCSAISTSDPVDTMTHSDEGIRNNECIQQEWK